ncbi:MAG: relaxase/mobilization nuclease domain-containing protein [Opitutales bacterium]|nr:relaxase/mobilization nuclease domain-containing protein [Opitutales bacterium]
MRSKAGHIRALTDYIRAPQMTNPEEKVGYSGARGFVSASHLGQQAEMIALATEASRCGNPLLHWLISWAEGEEPTDSQIEEIVDTFLDAMGMQGHQLIYAVHHNTDNYHLHLAVNRIDPVTIRPVFPEKGFDRDLAHQVIARIEQAQGWRSEPGALYRIDEAGRCVRQCERLTNGKVGTRATDMENLTGEQSLQRLVLERVVPIAAECADWDSFQWKLLKEDLAYKPRGRGAVIVRGNAVVKASVAGKILQLPVLEKRWGPFSLPETVARQLGFHAIIRQEPLIKEFPGLAKYLREQAAHDEARRLERRRLQIRHERERADAKRNGSKGEVLGVCVGAEEIRERLGGRSGEYRALIRRQGAERRRLAEQYPRFPHFEDWLRDRAKRPDLARRWRYRHSAPRSAPVKGPETQRLQPKQKEKHAHKNRKRRHLRADRWRRLGHVFERKPPGADSPRRHRGVGVSGRTAGDRSGDQSVAHGAPRERFDRGPQSDGSSRSLSP